MSFHAYHRVVNNTNKFTLGFFQPSHINGGTLSLITPTGRKTDGTIKWTNKEINAKENNDRLLFFSSVFSVAKSTNILLNMQESADSSTKFGLGETEHRSLAFISDIDCV